MTPGTTYTLQEVATMLHLSDRTISRYIKQGKIKAIKTSKKWLITASEVDKILNEGLAPSTTEPTEPTSDNYQ